MTIRQRTIAIQRKVNFVTQSLLASLFTLGCSAKPFIATAISSRM